MSRLDKLHSALMKRMSIVIREIWVEVEATVNIYQKEAAQTRLENARLQQQLEDALSRNETRLNGKVPVELTASELPPRIIKTSSESEKNQQTEDSVPIQVSPGCLETPMLDIVSVCKSEIVHGDLKDALSADERQTFPQFDASFEEAVNTAATPRIKSETEETVITITSSVTTTPAHGNSNIASETSQRLRRVTETLRRPPQKDWLRARFARARVASAINLDLDDDDDNEGPYKCNKCGRHLKDLSKLQLHKKLHERSFICHWCGRNFSKFDYLRMHMRTHTGERPYRCNWCSKTFSQSGNMRRHERICQRTSEEPAGALHEEEHLLSFE
ncbi:hypothetical protein DNTS_017834 [Danionella cerebrum]|uniref:C2H2-type domain-containing protein n=1 Tax=Danionella cerebrum TaxID=2873325 RepID=A0A553R0D4_9TELE|nr:hypothetical protein DNTS_017834 [Danionella translucida]